MTPVRAGEFGPLVIATDVDEMVLDMLKTWLPTHLRQVERERSSAPRFDLPVEDSYANTLDDEEFPDHTMPAILVTSANIEQSTLSKDGDGFYTAGWNLVVSCVVRGRTPSETRTVAALFEGAVRRVLLQEDPTWDGEVIFVGANTAAVADPTGAGRYLAAGIGNYVVYVDKIVQAGIGPASHPPDVYEADPDTPDVPFDNLVTVGKVTTDVVGRTPQSDLGS